MKGNSQIAPSQVRLPPDLRDWLKHQAIDNRRSFNSEVVSRLEESRTRQEKNPEPAAPQ